MVAVKNKIEIFFEFFKRHIDYLNKGHWEPLWIFLWFPLSFPVICLMRLLKPLLLVRISDFQSHSMGMMVECFTAYLCKREVETHVTLDILFSGKPANKQFLKMSKRVFNNIFEFPFYFFKSLDFLNHRFFSRNEYFVYPSSQEDIVNSEMLLDSFSVPFKFSNQEESFGLAEMRRMGILDDSRIVCLIVRDDAYFNMLKPEESDYENSYRNSSVNNFVLMSEYLVNSGYYVVRMGAKMSQSFPLKHPKMIDYACSNFRTDFMDIYLGKKCCFCVSTDTGWDTVPSRMFRKPVVYVNFSQLGLAHTFSKRFLFLAKKFISRRDGRELTLREIFQYGFTELRYKRQLDLADMQLVENSPEEIRDVVSEMVERLEATWKPSEKDERLQKRFWEIFPKEAVSSLDGTRLHGKIKAHYSAHYLRNNPDWLM